MKNDTMRELAARVLIEAAYTTDETACARYDVSLRSLQRWRKNLTSDAALAALVREKQEALNRAWADAFTVTHRNTSEAIGKCAVELAGNPDALRGLVEALGVAVKLVREVNRANKIINSRPPRGDERKQSQ